MRRDEYPNPVSDPEAEGLPSTADPDSTAYDEVESGRESDGRDPAAVPTDRPLGLDHHGTTAAEMRSGEPIDERLAAEVPEPGGTQTPELPDATGGTAGLPTEPATPGASATEPADGPPDPVLDNWVDTDNRTVEESPYDPAAGGGPGIDLDSPPDRVGRLVAPDAGAHTVREHDEIARDESAAGGGATAEESAMHLDEEGS